MTNAELRKLARRVGDALQARGWMLAAAESCTGGWIAKVLTDVPGSSGWFERGVVSYSNRAKVELLGVSPQALETHGAVSEAVVREMAEGLRARAPVQVTLAVSGIAGPEGGTLDKPVGTVWFAWSTAAETRARRHRFEGDREAVRRRSVAAALEGVLRAAAPAGPAGD